MPPYSSGIVSPKSPISRALRMSSSGIASASSICRERGSTSLRMKRRISSQSWRTSVETSMWYPSHFRLDQRVRRLHALAFFHDEQRIDVELGKRVFQIDRERREPHDRVGERLDVAVRLASCPREQRIAFDLLDHLASDRKRDGREPERDVLQHFGEDAAETEHDRRPEQRIV